MTGRGWERGLIPRSPLSGRTPYHYASEAVLEEGEGEEGSRWSDRSHGNHMVTFPS